MNQLRLEVILPVCLCGAIQVESTTEVAVALPLEECCRATVRIMEQLADSYSVRKFYTFDVKINLTKTLNYLR